MNSLLTAYKINTDKSPVWVFANNEGKARQTAMVLNPGVCLKDTTDVITMSQALFKGIVKGCCAYGASGECIGYSAQHLAPIPDNITAMDDDDVLLRLYLSAM